LAFWTATAGVLTELLGLYKLGAASASGAVEDLTQTGLSNASAGLSKCCARMETVRDLGAKRLSDVQGVSVTIVLVSCGLC